MSIPASSSASFNSSKKSITLDMSTAEARDIVRRLVPHFDVVAESFTPGTMAKWGLGYSDLQALRPDLIMLSTCMQGQTGPHAHYPGFGNLMASLSGFYYLSGYDRGRDRPALWGLHRFHRAPDGRLRPPERDRISAADR